MQTFARAADGRLLVHFYEGHRALLEMLLTEVRELIRSEAGGHRVTERLFPRAYLDPTEDVAEAEWQALVHDELVQAKVGAFDDVLAYLRRGEEGPGGVIELRLDAGEEEHLLAALNDLRLVLAELTGADAPDAAGTREPAGGAVDTTMLLEWLADLLSELVDLKLSELPE